MAVINTTLVDSLLQKNAPQAFYVGLTRRSTMWNLLQKLPPSDPQGPRWQEVTSTSDNAAVFAEDGVFPAASRDVTSEPALSWGRYVDSIKVTGDVLDKLAAGTLLIENYFMVQLNACRDRIVNLINTHLLSGANTNGITGITAAIDSTNTYAGLDRTSVTNFACYQNDNSATPRALTAAIMNTTHLNLVDTREGHYNVILTGQAQLDAYTTLTSGAGIPAVRTNSISTDGSQIRQVFIGGFGDASNVPYAFYRGVPVIAVPGYTTGRMDFIDNSRLAIEELRPFTVSEMRKENDNYYWDITWKGQLRLHNPRKSAALIEDLS